MQRSALRLTAAIAAALCCLFAAPTAHATVMVEVPLGEMVATADAVVRGVVVRTGTVVALEGVVLEPRTHTWIEVRESLAGAAVPRVVQLWEPGGRYGEVTVETIGTPRYRKGDEVVVFLRRDEARPDLFRTHQMAQGKYRVLAGNGAAGPRVVRELDDVAFASWTAGGGFDVRPAPPVVGRNLGDLLGEIRRAWADVERQPSRRKVQR